MNLYTLVDKKSNTCMPPFAAQNDGVACRNIMDALRDVQAMIAKYPKDYVLVHVGQYAEDDGMLVPAREVRNVAEVYTLFEALKAN